MRSKKTIKVIRSNIGISICNGIVSSSLKKTGICSGVLRKVATILSSNPIGLLSLSCIALVAMVSALNVRRKIMLRRLVNKSKNGLRRNRLNQKTWLGWRPSRNRVLNVVHQSRKTRVATIWHASNVSTNFAGCVWQTIFSTSIPKVDRAATKKRVKGSRIWRRFRMLPSWSYRDTCSISKDITTKTIRESYVNRRWFRLKTLWVFCMRLRSIRPRNYSFSKIVA